MKTKLLFLLVGLLVGVAGTVAIVKRQWQARDEQDRISRQQTEKTIAGLRRELATLERENRSLTTQVKDLQAGRASPPAASAAASTAAKPADSPFAAMLGGGSDTNRASAMGRFMKAAMQQQVEMQVGALKLRLGLTAEQEAAVRDVLGRYFGRGADAASKMMEGKMSKDELRKLHMTPQDLDAELKEIFSPEQQTAYEEYQVEQRRNQAEMMANVQLAQMQGMLQLREEQKDAVFDVLFEQAEKQLDPRTMAAMAEKGDFRKALQEQQTRLRTALAEVLTPEQMAIYDKQLESQREVMKMLLPGDDSKP
jgi:hypothetical protein